jgi:hypothetical protein
MSTRVAVVKRIIWPARASLFALVGGAVGLFGDLVSFLSDVVSAYSMTAVSGVAAAITAILCFRRAFKVNMGDDAAVEAVVQCVPCDAFRFALFATAASLFLLVVGQGKTATESVGRQLGIVADDVLVIRANVNDIRKDVDELRYVAQPEMIIDTPNTAADYFSNAWIYQYKRRDSVKALDSLDKMYSNYAPQRMDAAQLYREAGLAVLGRSALLGAMAKLAEQTGDATLLVAAAGLANSRSASDDLIARARRMDPELPFAWWEPQRMQPPRIGDPPAEQLKALRAQRADLSRFQSLYEQHPAAHFFFLPQFQGDFGAVAQQMAESMDQNIAVYEDIASGKLAIRVGEQTRRAIAEERARIDAQ